MQSYVCSILFNKNKKQFNVCFLLQVLRLFDQVNLFPNIQKVLDDNKITLNKLEKN